MRWFGPVLLVAGSVALTACAENLTPAQQRAWEAFQECRKLAPTANLTRLDPDGSLGFESREGDVQVMFRCLNERYGYKVQ